MASSHSSPPPPPQHTRTYQACIPCRRRKVRCDLGPVDHPHDPPCVRCRRESKECFFSATRRKRKPDGDDDGGDGACDDYQLRNGRKRPRSEQEGSEPALTPATAAYVSQPLTPGGSVGRHEPLRRPTATPAHDRPPVNEEDRQAGNEALATLQTGEVYSGHDALNLLFEAAGMDAHRRTASASNLARPSIASTPHVHPIRATPRPSADLPPLVDPVLQQHPVSASPNNLAFAAAVRAWSTFRFVRAGWLTAREAIAYIDYFYTYLSPLTPIVVPDYRDHGLHAKLLKEEPMLVVTILTIAARYAQPGGTTSLGATSRSYLIHEKLWKYLQGMIDRIIFGQEQFGGGFCGAGQQPGSDVNPLSRKGLRTLGTVESLMLLTEWHPRALHFPPGDDDDELVLPDDPYDSSSQADMCKAAGDKRIDSWLEPCWRSDRMCWMLLGNAMSLASEIGVFDDTSESEFEEANHHISHATVKAYYRRKNHLRDLLVIYLTQTSGRLGLTSMLPKTLDRDESLLGGPTPLERYQDHIRCITAPPPQFGTRSDGQRLPLESIATQERHAVQDLVLDFWERVAKIMELGNLKIYSNRRKTRELLRTGAYEEMLKFFQGPLADWRASFDRAPQVPAQLRHVLIIEFEYTRVYLNSLALQAVVERCTQNTSLQAHAQSHDAAAAATTTTTTTTTNGQSACSTGDNGGAIPFSTLVKWYANDRHYINEVIDASRNVLRVVVDGLYPGGYLRHAPVRTFFRIVSVAIILLKTFALGATEDDVAVSLGLLSDSVDALRTSIVDDVHVGNRFADLVETLTHRIRSRFVRLAANGSTAISRAASRSPVPASTMPPPASLNHPQVPGACPSAAPTSLPSSTLTASHSPSLAPTTSRATPLWGISSEPYDPTSNSISIMPPPGNYTQFVPHLHPAFSSSSSSSPSDALGSAWSHWANGNASWNVTPGGGGGGGGGGGEGAGAGIGNGNATAAQDQDWLTLPLDPLLDQWSGDMGQTSMGPGGIGGMDMLDILLNMGGPPGSTS